MLNQDRTEAYRLRKLDWLFSSPELYQKVFKDEIAEGERQKEASDELVFEFDYSKSRERFNTLVNKLRDGWVPDLPKNEEIAKNVKRWRGMSARKSLESQIRLAQQDPRIKFVQEYDEENPEGSSVRFIKKGSQDAG